LTTHVSGVLPVANGGTNASSASITAFNNITGYTASGATGTTSTNLVFSTSPSITTPTLVGDVTLSTGNLVIGTSGIGIDFSATAGTGTSELLADYEEGDWTPVIGGSTGTSGQTYDLQAGYYTKVGRLVTVTFRVALTAKGTITGNAQIQGLPYTIKNANGGQSSAAIGTFVLATNVVFVSGTGVLNGTAVNLTKLAASGSASTSMVVADIDPVSAFMGCFSYVV
jgi:hypothetical protein